MGAAITDIIERIKTEKAKSGITLYAPASLSDISRFEKVIGIRLPDEMVAFYCFSNGFETAEDMFRIIPLEEIIDNMKDRDSYIENLGDFHIAEYMIYCDMWTLHINPHDRNQYKIYNKANNTITLTQSFPDFLNVLLNGGVFDGLYSWREAIEKQIK